MQPRALIVDDEPAILDTLAGVLADGGVECLRTGSGEEALVLYAAHRPDVVFLDIWLPDRDGLATLQAIRALDPHATVLMMSGHGTTSTAVKAIKMGAFDYLEKPLTYAQSLEAFRAALEHRRAAVAGAHPEPPIFPDEGEHRLSPPPLLSLLRTGTEPQRTLRHSTVVYGLGLHSGGRTGMVLQPLPPDSGIHFLSLPSGTVIPAHVSAVGDTDYATTLARDTAQVRTVEHLLSALHAAGVTNLLVKLHAEVPVLDGSAADFCRTLEQIGLEDQDRPRREVVVDRRYEVTATGDKRLSVEPYDGFAVSYLLRYPPPIGEQFYEFTLTDFDTYKTEIAPARTFGFLRDLKMLNEVGLGSGGRLDNFILVGDDHVVNTELRFPDEFVRHKILDIVGDLYLLGYPLRGKVTARLTGHRDNVALVRQLVAVGSRPAA
ncbi:MAG: UDP-3-O-[3-hydroxymyristoyl] N-acetylglucosamine deacetylase [Thermoanaerobaculia bacterium]|nr:UDP-3-O-[3-hydroxymyristoyl] N-acetylglucosamine deacetylase [Thermoanaerobaculia bacterium]